MKKKLVISIVLLLASLLFGCRVNLTPTTSLTPTSSNNTTSSLSFEREQYLVSYLSSWGLGSTIISYYSNDRDYDWYINQMDTGIHGNTNCGPASVQMAGMWQSADFEHTAEEARSMFVPGGDWWYDTDISGALNHFHIDYEVAYVTNGHELTQAIQQGRIVLVNNNMSKIPYNGTLEARVNRFYMGVTGHYLIAKGVLITDTETYYEVYDPYNGDRYYADDTPRGQDRFYESSAFVESIVLWYSMIYLILP